MQQFDSFAQMQRDAAMRVMEMQKRAQAAMRNSAEPPDLPAQVVPATADFSDNGPLTDPDPVDSAPVSEEHSDDEAEKALLTAILLLLIKEKADERLIFALLYILM